MKEAHTCLPDRASDTPLVKNNLPLVKKIAARCWGNHPNGVILDDLVGAGSLGLVDAIAKERGKSSEMSLACYLRMRIRGAIYDELRANDWLPRRPRDDGNIEKYKYGPARPLAVIRFDDLRNISEREPMDKTVKNSSEILIEREFIEAFHQKLSLLSKQQQLVLHLRYFREMQGVEIARLLGLTGSRIAQIHSQALARLKSIMGNNPLEEISE